MTTQLQRRKWPSLNTVPFTGIALATIPLVLLILLPVGAHAQTAPVRPAGIIDLMEGQVTVVDSGLAAKAVKLKDTLYEGDSVSTGANGEMHLNMRDGGYLAVRPNTIFMISKYKADGADDDASVFTLLKGGFRSITGFIGKFHSANYRVNTPTLTIGIRGTDHEPLVVEEGDPSGEAGTYDKVNAGGTVLETPRGKIEVSPNHAAFAPRNGGAPRVLAAIPAVFHKTRNEGLLDRKHAEIQPKLEQLREQRRSQVSAAAASGARLAQPTPASAKPTVAKAVTPGNAGNAPAAAANPKAERMAARAERRQQAIAQQKEKASQQKAAAQAARPAAAGQRQSTANAAQNRRAEMIEARKAAAKERQNGRHEKER